MRALAGLLISGTLLLAGPALADACVDEPARAERYILDVGVSPVLRGLPGTPTSAAGRVGSLADLGSSRDDEGECWALLKDPNDPDRHV